MTVEFIQVPALGKLYGAYSAASSCRSTELFSIAGQFGMLADGSPPADGSVEAEVKQSFANLEAVLSHLGLAFTDVLRFNTFLVGRPTIAPFMSARLEVFSRIYPSGEYPPNTLLLVSGLVEEHCRVEIEAIAAR